MPVLRTKKKIRYFEDFEGLQGEEMKPYIANYDEGSTTPLSPENTPQAAPEEESGILLAWWRKLLSKLGISPQQ
ncbi:MAG: hypothetical protein KDD02_05730 [Phaeodactylibacter sp.]|nr:hypothetical protein [Phaeodactylibacter sp.]MCB9299946.1 hypothetical protein [Lewinellaceae bacterium]HQU59010.1 hypothetical protein [Saprospiraceae bacterium]